MQQDQKACRSTKNHCYLHLRGSLIFKLITTDRNNPTLYYGIEYFCVLQGSFVEDLHLQSAKVSLVQHILDNTTVYYGVECFCVLQGSFMEDLHL